MRTICDACESAAAVVFCAADEAALCLACDDKVHMVNKLASRHVRVGLANPSDVPRCDICENGPAFFYCEVDGSSLCLQCDVSVHVGGKRKHARYLLLRQRVEFPGDQTSQGETKKGQREQPPNNNQSHGVSHVPKPLEDNTDGGQGKMDNELIDLNMKPLRFHEQPPNDH